MQRRLPLGSRFGQNQTAVLEIDGQQANFAGNRRLRRAPPETASDHEMEDQKDVVFELENDALAEPAQRCDGMTRNTRERRVDRTKQERARKTDPTDAMAENARVQRVQIESDIRKLRHRSNTIELSQAGRRRTRASV